MVIVSIMSVMTKILKVISLVMMIKEYPSSIIERENFGTLQEGNEKRGETK